MFNPEKYSAYPQVTVNRTWPDKTITTAPRFCRVDLRDGNQALSKPMNIKKKLAYFNMLTKIGFKEIEVGFPAASQIEFNFVRELIVGRHVPEDVQIQVLVQIKEDQIKRTCEALQGSKNAIIHLYNSTSPVQRQIVFRKTDMEIIELATQGVRWIQKYAQEFNIVPILEYSPESFTDTELSFARDICNAVIEAWQPKPEHKMIINIPATVERSTPNIFADRVEWLIRELKNCSSLTISVHTHNDRGTAIAASELAILAGAERVEGTLFGNGERSGNCYLLVMALNLYTQGVDIPLDFTNIEAIKASYGSTHQLPIHPRHPYAGKMIFTAYSGSHQDAIYKGLKHQVAQTSWTVPYIPLDPQDIGATKDFVKFTSQSGRGGLRYILEKELGVIIEDVPDTFFTQIQNLSEQDGGELSAAVIKQLYLIQSDQRLL
jgi:2-isopropylmalate synthase